MKRICTVIATALAAACSEVPASVGATRAWTSNYVASVVAPVAEASGDPAAISNLVRSVMAEMLNSSVSTLGGYEDDMTATTNGHVSVYVAVSYHDSVVLERREFSVAAVQTNTPPCLGCRIVSSALADAPTGTLYAVAADGLRVRDVNAAQPEFEIYSTTNGWRLYGVGGGATYDSVDLSDGGRVRVGAWTNGVLRGTFTVQPWALTEEEASACLGGEPSGYSAWADLATNRAASVTIAFSEDLDADETGGSGGGVTFDLNYHGPDYVDYEELWPTDDEHYWSPRYGLMRGDWENPANWIAFPLTVSITYDDAGETRTRTDIINSMDRLDRLLRRWDIKLNIPPFPYNYPVLKKHVSFECEKFGHVWRSCTCNVCGETRSHYFASENEGECEKCQNKDTDRRRTDDGEWEVFELDRKCGRNDEEGILDYHAGWHHVTPPGDEEDGEWLTFCCSCQCGCFSPNSIMLSHALEYTEGDPEYYDEDTHKVIAICTRRGCLHVAYRLEEHMPDFTEDYTMEYMDRYEHKIVGTCEECGGFVYGMQSHLWGYYGYDEDTYCCCPCFFETDNLITDLDLAMGDGGYPLLHTSPKYRAMVNPHDITRVCEGEAICDRCGANLSGVLLDFPPEHHFGYETDGRPDGVGNDEFHYCACGSQTEMHSPEYFDDGIMVCQICKRSRDDDKGRGGRPGNESETTKDPNRPDPTPPDEEERNPPRPPWRPPWFIFDPYRKKPDPKKPDPTPPDPDPEPDPVPDPIFPQIPPDFPGNGGNGNGGNSSVTIDPNSHTNNVPWRVVGGNNIVIVPCF